MTSNFEMTFNAYNYLLSFFSTKNTFPKYPLPKLFNISNEVMFIFYEESPIINSVLSIFYYNSFSFSYIKLLNFSNEYFLHTTDGNLSFF